MIKKIIIGCANIGNNYGLKKKKILYPVAYNILKTANTKNIFHFDTAQDYKQSEKILGKIIKNLKNKKKILVDTKLAKKITSYDFESIKSLIIQSIRKLKISRINTLYIHNTDQLKGARGKILFSALQKIKKSRLINKIGISVYSVYEIKSLLKKYKVDVVQAPINVLDNRFIETDLIKILKKKKIKLVARSIFLKGFLLKNPRKLPNQFLKYRKLLKSFIAFSKQHNQSRTFICLKFVLKHKFVDKVILGISSSRQLKSLIKSLNKKQKLKKFIIPQVVDKHLLDPRSWKNK